MNRLGRIRSWAARTLFVFGLVCVAWCGWAIAKEKSFQARAERQLQRESSRAVDPAKRPASRSHSLPDILGRLEIPRVNLSAMVVEGDDDETLEVAVGHLPDTPLPWQPGNSALAGHRDTFFRPLKDVRIGDELRLTTARGSLRYRVDRTLIVDPNNLSVLEPTPAPTLTLVTCFPFFYVGHAPRRFVVRASQVGIDPAPGN